MHRSGHSLEGLRDGEVANRDAGVPSSGGRLELGGDACGIRPSAGERSAERSVPGVAPVNPPCLAELAAGDGLSVVAGLSGELTCGTGLQKVLDDGASALVVVPFAFGVLVSQVSSGPLVRLVAAVRRPGAGALSGP